MSTSPASAVLTTANAIQALIEAIQPLQLLAPEPAKVEKALDRARRARVELNQWVEESRD